jgi:hypothetical protein
MAVVLSASSRCSKFVMITLVRTVQTLVVS